MMKKSLIFALSLLVVSCSSPTPRFFQPVALQSADMNYSNVKTTVLVNQVLLPAEVSRPQITTLGKENFEIKIDEFNRWGATPERLIQQVLSQNLALYLPNAIIETQTPLRKNYQYGIMVEISEMSGRLDDYVSLKASYFIRNKQGKIIKSARFAQTKEIDGAYDAYVPAQSALLAELSSEIASQIAKLK